MIIQGYSTVDPSIRIYILAAAMDENSTIASRAAAIPRKYEIVRSFPIFIVLSPCVETPRSAYLEL